MKLKHSLLVLLSVWFTVVACGSNESAEQNTTTTTDTNYSDSRRNSTGTVNTISGDSTATHDSAQHGGREGQD